MRFNHYFSTIRARIYLLLAASVLGFITVCSIAIVGTSRLSKSGNQLYREGFQSTKILLDIQHTFDKMQVIVIKTPLEYDQESQAAYKREYLEHYANLQASLEDYKAVTGARSLPLLEKLQELTGQFRQISHEVFSLAENFAQIQANEIIVSRLLKHGARVEAALGELIELQNERLGEITESMEESSDHSIKTMLAGAFLTLVVLSLIGGAVAVRLAERIHNTVDRILALADQDVETEIPYLSSPDEVGAIARALWLFKENEIERKRLESVGQKQKEALLSKEKELQTEKRFSALGRMAGGLAHEVNNPMMIIHGNLEMLQMTLADAGGLDEASREILQQTFKASRRVTSIVRSLREFSRDGSTYPLSVENIGEVVDEVVGFCYSAINRHAVDVAIDVSSEFPLVACRRVDLSQVIINLVNNAAYAIKDLEERWIKIEADASPDRVELYFTDSGKGISEDIRDKIMEPFFSTKPVGEGTGLGLSVCKGLIESMNGSLYLDDSHENTRFVIALMTEREWVGECANE